MHQLMNKPVEYLALGRKSYVFIDTLVIKK